MRGGRSGQPRPRWLLLVSGLTLLFLALPLVVIVTFSFNSSKSLSSFESFSTRWYVESFTNEDVIASLTASITIALVTTLVAVALGSALAFAFVRHRQRRAVRTVESVSLMTLVTPEIATAIGLLLLFSTIGIPLSNWTVILGHITFSLMYVAVVVGASLRLVRTDLEEAARDLGATAPETLRLIVLPQVLPAVAGAAMLVFVISFDDFVTSVFLSGSEVAPLPVRIYGMLRYGLTPEVNALGTSMMLASVVIGLAGIWIVNRRTSTRQSTALA